MSRRAVLRRLLGLLRPAWGMMAFSATMRVANQLAGMALLAAAAWGVARAATGGLESPWRWLGLLVGIGLAKGLFRYLEQFSGHYVAFRLLSLLRRRFYRALVPLAPAGLGDLRSGDVVARAIGDVDRLEPFYAHTVAPAVAALAVPGAATAALAAIEPRLAWTALPFFLLQGLVVPLLAARWSRRAGGELRRLQGELEAHLTDGFQGLREVLAFGYGGRRRAELRGRGEAVAAERRRLGRVEVAASALAEGLPAAALAALLWVGLGLTDAGRLAILELPVALAVALMTFPALAAVAAVAGDFEQAMAAAERLFALIERPPPVTESPGAEPPPETAAAPAVRFENVTFAYRPGEPVLRGLDLELPAGDTTALVGPSGAGKSTLVHLLARFSDPDAGRVLLGGRDLRDLTLTGLRRRLAVVSQRTHLFDATLEENLRLARPDASREDLDRVLADARLEEFVASLPEGLDTPAGELGRKLSGGQRQRLAIARALLKDAPVLVLDEATAELDASTERELRATLAELARGRTTLTIAHRLATVAHLPRIAVLDRGRIVELGSHPELLARGGLYARLWALQQDEFQASSRSSSS